MYETQQFREHDLQDKINAHMEREANFFGADAALIYTSRQRELRELEKALKAEQRLVKVLRRQLENRSNSQKAADAQQVAHLLEQSKKMLISHVQQPPKVDLLPSPRDTTPLAEVTIDL